MSAGTYRQIYISFWHDPFVLKLPSQEKYFYIYLITNEYSTICGIYELPLQIAAIHLGMDEEKIISLLDKFEKYGKIKYSHKTGEICIKNFLKYNSNTSPKTRQGIINALKNVKDESLIKHLAGLDKLKIYPMQVVSNDEQYPIQGVSTGTETGTETETETETATPLPPSGDEEAAVIENSKQPVKETDPVPYEKIKDLYNSICTSFPKVLNVTGKRRKAVSGRWKEYEDLTAFETLFRKTQDSAFMRGELGGDWRGPDFDWLMCPTNMAKVLEGKYDDAKGRTPPDTPDFPSYEADLEKDFLWGDDP